MEKKTDFEKLVGERITYFRKEKKMTQFELAQIMNYSDKTISKWELGQSLPSIFVLNELAQVFGVSLDVLIGNIPITPKEKRKAAKFKFAFIYSLLVFTVFFIAFGILFIVLEDIKYEAWNIILWGIAGSTIPIFVYSIIYKKQWSTYISLSVFVWMLAVTLHLALSHIQGIKNLYVLYIIAIPLNLLLLSFLVYYFNHSKNKIPRKKKNHRK